MVAMAKPSGLAMMLMGRQRKACRLTWATTSGTSESMRQAEELSITTAPADATLMRQVMA